MIPKAEIRDQESERGLSNEVIESDYVLGWLVWGIGSNPALSENWALKGGTCIKSATCHLTGTPRTWTSRFSQADRALWTMSSPCCRR